MPQQINRLSIKPLLPCGREIISLRSEVKFGRGVSGQF
ncbi:hypothetical protein HMPREF1054_1993 [Haemophilus paraphrohaemolyticus HK411]|uniref:Uncharacterized protein n=1 Tax=Haemophilus paraphrohaemolyticus HK411 TaxID=1095743 RepID=I2NL11_9PAST|nr:hypothetical protein HMPREF1054_1993 [Haemophilus paraphrohaemolyticus HK411]